MNIEEVRAGKPITVGAATLIPIERTCVSGAGTQAGAVFSASKGVAGIVVSVGKNRYALDLTGEQVPMEEYLSQVPELAPLLDRL